MRASHDATALRAPRAQRDGNGAAMAKTQLRESPLATPEQLRERFAVEDARYAVLREWIQSFLQEGVDFGRIPGCGPKPALFKPGAEKICQRFHFQPRFFRDAEACEMFGNKPGLVCLRCELLCRDTAEVVGEGRGAARLDERKGWTENNCLKMAEKRAQIDAVLRTIGLSEVFTQDIEDSAETPTRANRVSARPRPTEHRDSDRAQAWVRLRDCLLLLRADRDERKAIRLRRDETELRSVRKVARQLLAEECGLSLDKAHLATAVQLNALCDRLDAAKGIDFETGRIYERQVG